MKSLYFVVLMAALACCIRPSLKNALRNQVIIDFKNNIVPFISKQVSHLTLPDVHTSSSGFKIDITSIHVDINPFNGNQIGIQFVPNTSIIRFSGRGFGMQGHAHIHAKWTIISKSFDATIGVRNLGFDCQITALSYAGKPIIHVDSVQVHLSSGDISIHFSGGIINKILEFIANLLKGHFVKEIVGQLQSKLPPMITEEVNKRLKTIPSEIDVGPHLQLKYSFPNSPFVRDTYLFTGIVAYIHPKGNPTPPPYECADMPEFDANNPKGIQFFFSDYVVRSSLDSSFAAGMLVVSFEKDMLEHHIKMTCRATSSPVFAFKNAIDVTVASICDVVLDRNDNTKFAMISEVHVNLKEYMKQAVLFFTINEAKFLKLEYKQEKPVDIEWFKNGVNKVLEAIKEIVNSELGAKGIPLPTIQGIDYTDTVQYVKEGYLQICTNPVFHFTSETEEEK